MTVSREHPESRLAPPGPLGLTAGERSLNAPSAGLSPLPLTPSAFQAAELQVLPPRHSHSTTAMPHATVGIASPVEPNGSGDLPPVWERPLGDSELSYFLPSRHEGINDMCAAFLCSLLLLFITSVL